MKKIFRNSLIVLISLAAIGAVNAQSFSVSLGLPSSNLVHSRSRILDNHSVISVVYDNSTYSSHVSLLNSNGVQVWAKQYQNTKIDDIVELPSGNLAFAGNTSAGASVWGVLDSDGDFLWAKQYYSFSYNYDLASVDILKSGKILYNFSKYTNSVTVRCDEGGNTEDCDEGEDTLGLGKNPCFDSFGCEDSGYVSCNKSDDRIMIIRHAANGDVMWAKNYMKASSEYFHLKKIQELSDGSFMGVGLVNDTYTGMNNNGFIIKMDNTGEVLWTKKYHLGVNPGYFSSTFRDFEVVEGNIYVSGYYTSDNMNMNNFLIKMDANGEVISSKQMVATNGALAMTAIPTMGYVSFEHDMKDNYLVYNNYGTVSGLTVEINKVAFDGTLGCEVTDFPLTAISYNAITSTQPAHYGQNSILETTPAAITPVTIVVTSSGLTQTESCASIAGIDDLNTLNLSVYPNPASEILNISGLNVDRDYMVQMIDLTGKIVQVNKGISGVEMTSIPVAGLSRGSYLVSILDLSNNSSVQMNWVKM